MSNVMCAQGKGESWRQDSEGIPFTYLEIESVFFYTTRGSIQFNSKKVKSLFIFRDAASPG